MSLIRSMACTSVENAPARHPAFVIVTVYHTPNDRGEYFVLPTPHTDQPPPRQDGIQTGAYGRARMAFPLDHGLAPPFVAKDLLKKFHPQFCGVGWKHEADAKLKSISSRFKQSIYWIFSYGSLPSQAPTEKCSSLALDHQT